jgi:hypothetical protein
MPTITITLDVPEGTTATVAGGAQAAPQSNGTARDPAERYFREYLSDNGRWLYAAAAKLERKSGVGYTLEDVAGEMGVPYKSAQSIHRTTGRAAKRWRKETGTDTPILLEDLDYDWDEQKHGRRTTYRLPEGLAAAIEEMR